MTESMKYYESIRRKYPEAVSKDQFYQIAHISKATALHLLQNGLVPCKDTGKKTRRYTIRTDDIIFYLIDRELHPEVYRAPDRWYQERSGHYNSRVTYRNELTRLSEEERASFRKYMEDEFCQYGDLLTIVEVAEAIGYLNDYSLGVEGMSHEELIDKLYTEMAEFSFLTPYLFANDVEEININSWKDVKITYADGRVVPTKDRFQTPQHAVDVIRRLLHKSGMILDNSQPGVVGHLSNKIRITVLGNPLTDKEKGVAASIRIMCRKPLSKMAR